MATDPDYPLDRPEDDPKPKAPAPPEPPAGWRGRRMAGADLAGEDLRDAHLSGADLSGAKLGGSDLRGLDLRGTRLVDADLCRADLRDAILDDADLDSANLTEVRGNGLRANAAHFELADLRDADLSFADLSGATLTDANLTRARLRRATLSDADLIGAQLGGADFNGARLCGANLRESHLDAADFRGAHFGFTVFAASNLSRAHGLERAIHDAPSTVGIDAFLLSRGEIPEAFLRGTGLSSLTVEYLKSVAAAEEGMIVGGTVWLLFAPGDRARARRLRAYLRMHGRSAWYWRETSEWAHSQNTERSHRVHVDERWVLLDSLSSRSDPTVAEVLSKLRDSPEPPRLTRARIDSPDAAPNASSEVRVDFRGVDWSNPSDPRFHAALGTLLETLR